MTGNPEATTYSSPFSGAGRVNIHWHLLLIMPLHAQPGECRKKNAHPGFCFRMGTLYYGDGCGFISQCPRPPRVEHADPPAPPATSLSPAPLARGPRPGLRCWGCSKIPSCRIHPSNQGQLPVASCQ